MVKPNIGGIQRIKAADVFARATNHSDNENEDSPDIDKDEIKVEVEENARLKDEKQQKGQDLDSLNMFSELINGPQEIKGFGHIDESTIVLDVHGQDDEGHESVVIDGF